MMCPPQLHPVRRLGPADFPSGILARLISGEEMTARELFCLRSRGRFADRSFHFLVPLCGGPRFCKGRDVHQIVSDDAEPDPSVHAVDAMVATATQAVTTFEHTDATFAPDAPALAAAEPVLPLIGTPRRRLGAATRQDHASNTASGGGLFVGRRAEAAIARGQIRRAGEDRLVAIQRGGPQRHVGRAFRVDVVRRDDRMFRFLNGDELAEFVRLRNLAPFRIVSVCGSKMLSTLSGTWVSPPRRRARV